jgi:hypothetical protein
MLKIGNSRPPPQLASMVSGLPEPIRRKVGQLDQPPPLKQLETLRRNA